MHGGRLGAGDGDLAQLPVAKLIYAAQTGELKAGEETLKLRSLGRGMDAARESSCGSAV